MSYNEPCPKCGDVNWMHFRISVGGIDTITCRTCYETAKADQTMSEDRLTNAPDPEHPTGFGEVTPRDPADFVNRRGKIDSRYCPHCGTDGDKPLPLLPELSKLVSCNRCGIVRVMP